jgi:Lrp/AsnC family leucine-responsive transcriptional regulator
VFLGEVPVNSTVGSPPLAAARSSRSRADAARTAVSPPAVAERVRRLEESGVITGHHARVDLTRTGWPVLAMIRISCYGPRCVLRDPDVARWAGVLEIHRITGDAC